MHAGGRDLALYSPAVGPASCDPLISLCEFRAPPVLPRQWTGALKPSNSSVLPRDHSVGQLVAQAQLGLAAATGFAPRKWKAERRCQFGLVPEEDLGSMNWLKRRKDVVFECLRVDLESGAGGKIASNSVPWGPAP